MQESLYKYLLRLGDNSLILSQRLSEWCGHGPALEEDIALTNIALDLIGQSTQFLEYAGSLGTEKKTADELAFLRDAPEFRNTILVELPNGDYAFTIARQFIFSAYLDLLYKELMHSSDEQVRAIAAKSSKELGYHYKHSRDWIVRLGDGTEESHNRIQAALDEIWTYSGELFEDDAIEQELHDLGIACLNSGLYEEWKSRIEDCFKEATLSIPEDQWMQTGGRNGKHSEHLGFILSDMQFLQRAYPGNQW